MAWQTEYVLEGLWTFGEPLDIRRMELNREPAGWEPLPYHRIHMNLADSQHIWDRLMGLKNVALGRLTIIEVGKKEARFQGCEFYSLQRDFRPSNYPYEPWPGMTFGIRFDRTNANDAAVRALFHGGYKLGRL